MTWTDKQILDALRMIEGSAYDEVRIETSDFKLHVRRNGVPSALGGTSVSRRTVSESVVAAADSSPPVVEQVVPTTSPPAASASVSETIAVVPPGVTVVRAPMIGTFYRAPSPQSAPFVEAGGAVQAGDTVCLIEVMKLFNTIKAGIDGRVVRILAENAATVRKDQPLFWIQADA